MQFPLCTYTTSVRTKKFGGDKRSEWQTYCSLQKTSERQTYEAKNDRRTNLWGEKRQNDKLMRRKTTEGQGSKATNFRTTNRGKYKPLKDKLMKIFTSDQPTHGGDKHGRQPEYIGIQTTAHVLFQKGRQICFNGLVSKVRRIVSSV